MQKHPTPTNKSMAPSDEQTNLSKLDGMTIKLGKSQDPMVPSQLQCHLELQSQKEDQLTFFISAGKQSFADDNLDQIKTLVLDNMSDSLI